MILNNNLFEKIKIISIQGSKNLIDVFENNVKK